ncbi:MAG: SGNH/GDSL hydrolase family protein [Planctomycetota bacterium]|jgi:hypothetical protein|nr:SGNH/GDSL hydrolase family protein [Planctomycetota bacterium]MDP6990304.1 SGNH/GDSL hydrolase family protein [Planctomycetota bacterium]
MSISRLVISFAASLVLAEVALRLAAEEDLDGNVTLAGRRLLPYRFPGQRLAAVLEEWGEEGVLAHSPDLGWRPRPGAVSVDGLYAYDALGVRVADPAVPTTLRPSEGVRRLVLVGDSYSHGDDVPFAESLGAHLEAVLAADRAPCEVVNLAVGGYGIDQAYLRLVAEGLDLAPKVVLLGLQVENVQRNHNILRGYYFWRTGIPYSKPRFLLGPEGLHPVNSPVVPMAELPGVLLAGGTTELLAHEEFYDPGQYELSAARRSYLYRAGETLLGDRQPQAREIGPEGEEGALVLALLDAARRATDQAGARFVVVLLPDREELARLRSGRRRAHAALLDAVAGRFETVDVANALLGAWERVGPGALFTPGRGHYSSEANEVVARVVAGGLDT